MRSFKAAQIFASLAFIAGLLSCAAIGKQLIAEPKVELSRIGIKDLGANGATVMLGIQVANPNPFELKVDSLKYNLEVGGKAIGTGQIPSAVRVAGHATDIIDIPVTVKFEDLFSSAFDFLQKNSTSYRVTGEARSGLLTVPFDRTGDLKLK